MSDNSPQKTVHRKDGQRPQCNSVKESGDFRDQEKKARSKSKNRIPKRLRYDLENALVGLCDVWFEEIKPYLVRNNVKLHVHDDTGGGSGDRSEVPSTFNCSHLDPASSLHECELCKLLFNAANSIESALSQAATNTPVPENYSTNCKKERARKPRKRRKCQQAQQQPVPRLCRTYSIPPLTSPTKKIANTLQRISHLNNQELKLKRKPQMKNASIQTDYSDNIKIIKKIFNAKHPSPKLFRRDSTVTFTSKQNEHQKDIPLFQDDLIDIIAKRHEKKMELLTSPRKENFPSIMNLYVSSKIKRKPKELYKIRPWR